MKNYSQQVIYENQTVREGLVKLDSLSIYSKLTLFVVNDRDQMVGTLTDGDIRRALINGKSLDDKLGSVMYRNFRYLERNNYKLNEINEIKKAKIVPLLDEEKRIIKIIDFEEQNTILPIDAVIMAGGKGERLRPFTNTTPKPLLKIDKKPIIEYNIDRLIKFGVDNIFITLGYLGDQIKEYFGSGKSKGVNLIYTNEEFPTGTAGALGLIKEFKHDNILLMNADILTNMDFEDFFRKFEENDSDITMATIPYKVNIPYAVIELEEENIVALNEKPTYTYYSNAGIYLLKRNIVNNIPENCCYNATDLVEVLISQGRKVTSYPILQYWLDIGKHEDFIKAQEDIKHIKF